MSERGQKREKGSTRDNKSNLPLHLQSIPFFCFFRFLLCACVRMRVYYVCIDGFTFLLCLCFCLFLCVLNLFRIACDTFPLWYKQASIELHLIKNDYFSWSLRQTLTTMAPGIKANRGKKVFIAYTKKPMHALWNEGGGTKMKRVRQHQKH